MLKNIKKTNVSTSLAKNAEKYQESMSVQHHWPKMLKNIEKTNVSTTSLAKNAEKYQENKCQYNIAGQKC
jgi:hypothetical protein